MSTEKLTLAMQKIESLKAIFILDKYAKRDINVHRDEFIDIAWNHVNKVFDNNLNQEQYQYLNSIIVANSGIIAGHLRLIKEQ